MFIKCSWCGKDMGEKEPKEDKRTTHGMCENCKKEQEEEMEGEPKGEPSPTIDILLKICYTGIRSNS
jgi:DNA-directed RNA polymerase subunit RPC12/RpoP